MNKTTLIAFLLVSSNTFSMKLSTCEKVLLGDMRIKDLIKTESAKGTSEYLRELKGIKSCNGLIDMAALQSNGMVRSRNPISAQILKIFVDLHHNWIMPVEPEYVDTCQDRYQWDVYDKLAPSYHLTRALFQEDRNISLALTGYGDLRSIRAGDNPTVSKTTGISNEQYIDFLKTEDKFTLNSEKDIVGFLYKRKLSTTNFKVPRNSTPEENWPKENLNIYKHFGGGLLGSPSFLYYYGQKKAFYRSNGRQLLPRKYASAISNNLLCHEPKMVHDPQEQEIASEWNHPITQEANCLSCHRPLDQMAAGFRHITFLPTKKKCSKGSAQIYIPFSFNSKGQREVWSKTNSKPPFHLSYPVSYHQDKRSNGLSQLGKTIADDINFYKCQVGRYHEFLHGRKAASQYIESLALKYKDHQNGLKLIKEIMAKESKSL